jgi:quinoprotein glucose dehydrogenase
MMPTVGRGLVDEEGAALVEEWIGQMRVDEQLARRALNPVEAYREALAGGDASRGRELFYFSSAKCSSCHRADRPDGGEVGPSLADVGSRTQREYLLESIVSPSAKIVEKYAAAIIEHEEGQIYTGIIASEDANELVLKAADATQIKLLKSGIANRAVSPVSIMPSMANILSVQDVADLVEFLSSQKAVP